MNALRLPTSNTTQATQVGNIMNMVYRDIEARNPNWWWLRTKRAFNTATAVQGTATVVYGGQDVTLSTAPASEHGSFMGRAMLVSNATDSTVYRISTHATGSASFTLDAAYVSMSTTSASVTVYKDSYDAPSDFNRPVYLSANGGATVVRVVGAEEMAGLKQWDTTEGAPTAVTLEGFRTAGDFTTPRQIVVHPWPDVPHRLELAYQRTLNSEASGETRFLIPDEYIQVLVYGTLARAYPIMLDDADRGQTFERDFNDVMALMTATQRKWEGNPRLEIVDQYRGFYRRRSR